MPVNVNGTNVVGVQVPESVSKFYVKKAAPERIKSRNNVEYNPVEMAKDQFEIAANAGCDLGLKWLKFVEEKEKDKEREKSGLAGILNT